MGFRRRDGTPPPEATSLRAGPLSMTFESGSLRWIGLGEIELLRGVYGTVRDDAWRNVEARIDDVRIEERARSFRVSFAARHQMANVDFSWRGTVTGEKTGRVRFDFHGVAGSTFARNRIGLCVLHPMALAGVSVTVETAQGIRLSDFPVDIAAEVPFTDVVWYRWQPEPGIDLKLSFAGDLFEMEDQRNWTDASYKTYCNPTHFPFPVEIRQGTRIEQSVILELEERWPRRSTTAVIAPSSDRSELVLVGSQAELPMPAMGLALAPGRERLDDVEAVWVDRLRLTHLRVVLDLLRPTWQSALDAAMASSQRLGCALELEVVAGDDGGGLAALLDRLANASIPLMGMFVFPTSSLVTTDDVIDEARRALETAHVPIRVAGGSRGTFADFNMSPIPIERLDIAGFPMNAQVHAYDAQSVMETIPAQALVVANARRICGDVPLGLGPITLRPRFDADARPIPAFGRETESMRSDARQSTLFAAAWTVGSLAALIQPGVESLTYFEATGLAGMVPASSGDTGATKDDKSERTPSPTYRVFEAIGELDRPAALDVTSRPDIACLGFRHAGGSRVVVANLRSTATTLRLRLAGGDSVDVQRLGETPDARWQGSPDVTVTSDATSPGGLIIELPMGAYGVVRVDGRP